MKVFVTSASLRVAHATCSVLGVLSNFLADGVSCVAAGAKEVKSTWFW